ELARGQIIGDSYGMLKLLVSPEDRRLLGVHVFGTGATELVHIGQTVMGCGGTVDYLVNAVFNYPTLAESYKVAALDAMNKMRHIERLSGQASRRPEQDLQLGVDVDELALLTRRHGLVGAVHEVGQLRQRHLAQRGPERGRQRDV